MTADGTVCERAYANFRFGSLARSRPGRQTPIERPSASYRISVRRPFRSTVLVVRPRVGSTVAVDDCFSALVDLTFDVNPLVSVKSVFVSLPLASMTLVIRPYPSYSVRLFGMYE